MHDCNCSASNDDDDDDKCPFIFNVIVKLHHPFPVSSFVVQCPIMVILLTDGCEKKKKKEE